MICSLGKGKERFMKPILGSIWGAIIGVAAGLIGVGGGEFRIPVLKLRQPRFLSIREDKSRMEIVRER